MADTWDFIVNGCDAGAPLFNLELSPSEVALLQRIAEMVEVAAADRACAPTLTVQPTPTPAEKESCTRCWEYLGDTYSRDCYGAWVHVVCPRDM